MEDFTGKSSKVFEGANHIDGSPPPNLVKMAEGDVEAWIDAVLFPPYIVANAPMATEGLWASNAVSVTIASLGSRTLSASITDTTAHPTLQFQETFGLGQLGWAFNTFALGVQKELQASGGAAASAVVRAAASTLRSVRPDEDQRVVDVIHQRVRTELGEQKITVAEAKLAGASKAAAAVGTLARSSVLLSHGVCLTLYDEFEAGNKVGSRSMRHLNRVD